MPRPKTIRSKKISAKQAMASAISEARDKAAIKPIVRASKSAQCLKASPWDKYRYRKVRLRNGTVECDTDQQFNIIAKEVKAHYDVDILSGESSNSTSADDLTWVQEKE